MKSEIQMRLIRTNFKSMLLAIMAINEYVLMVSKISRLGHTQVKMLFNPNHPELFDIN